MSLAVHPQPIHLSTDAAPTPGLEADPATGLEAVEPRRVLRAKKAYTTRFLARRLEHSAEGFTLASGNGVVPSAGDIVLARVTQVGKHTKLEGPGSRRQALFVGDEILVAYGHRYAPDQFLAEVPDNLDRCHLVAAGGMAARATARHAGVGAPTVIEPIGLLADAHGVLNLARLAPRRVTPDVGGLPGRPPVIAVLGTSMNSGKSTTLGCLVNGLAAAGLEVAAGKATGTGSGNDPLLFADAGAARVLDFTDFGYPSTFRLDYDQVRGLLGSLVGALAEESTDVVVVEIADGLYQGETRRLLSDPVFHRLVDRVVFSAADALGATAGVEVLRQAGLRPAAVSGLLTASPLAAREAAAVIDLPVLDTYSLCDPTVALGLLPVRAN
jgi:hypothetical protein